MQWVQINSVSTSVAFRGAMNCTPAAATHRTSIMPTIGMCMAATNLTSCAMLPATSPMKPKQRPSLLRYEISGPISVDEKSELM